MNAPLPRLRPLLPAWLGGQSPDEGSDGTRWRLWTDIEDFLTEHEIAPSPATFDIAHAYLTGDAAVRAPIEYALRADGKLTPATIDAIAGERERQGMGAEFLAEIAGRLERRLGEVMHMVGQSATSARDYGDALDSEARQAASDPAGAFDRLIVMTRDVVAATRAMEVRLDTMRAETERLKSDLDSARKAAERDHLTGLPNRRSFDKQLAEEASATACLALCDIDDFKRINDRHGHETGDRVLRFVAKTLKQELRGKALVSRYGGEEFACLFADGDLASACEALDGIRERLKLRTLVDRTSGQPIGTLTFSAGLTAIAHQPRDALRAADTALYAAKRAGKDRVELAGTMRQN